MQSSTLVFLLQHSEHFIKGSHVGNNFHTHTHTHTNLFWKFAFRSSDDPSLSLFHNVHSSLPKAAATHGHRAVYGLTEWQESECDINVRLICWVHFLSRLREEWFQFMEAVVAWSEFVLKVLVLFYSHGNIYK